MHGALYSQGKLFEFQNSKKYLGAGALKPASTLGESSKLNAREIFRAVAPAYRGNTVLQISKTPRSIDKKKNNKLFYELLKHCPLTSQFEFRTSTTCQVIGANAPLDRSLDWLIRSETFTFFRTQLKVLQNAFSTQKLGLFPQDMRLWERYGAFW